MGMSTMCRMCGQNKNIEGFNDEGECADCDQRIELRAKKRLGDKWLESYIARGKRIDELEEQQLKISRVVLELAQLFWPTR